MKIIGRKKEQSELKQIYDSGKPEFVTVSGRRRVGKTYLIREYFGEEFAFTMTGSKKFDTKGLLRLFDDAISMYSDRAYKPAKDWLEAFGILRDVLERKTQKGKKHNRQVIFIDELPWFDRNKSDFLAALEHFWNNWASSQPQIMLIVCGSATSWIVKKLFRDRGGLYGRITARINLAPFTLGECEEYFSSLGLVYNRLQVMESYMVFGGIPYYLGMFSKKYSVRQNVDRLFFSEGAQLRYEYEELFASLFRNPERYLSVIEALNEKKFGLTRNEISEITRLYNNGSLTTTLSELEQCGFIIRFTDFTNRRKGSIYKLIDPFILFYLRFVGDKNIKDEFYWSNYSSESGYNAWVGLSFEQVCVQHISQIKSALGISGVSAYVSSWRSAADASQGAQIDLLIDRRDGIINVCEIKYSDKPYTIDKKTDEALAMRRRVFSDETRTRKTLHQTMITPFGLSERGYHASVQSEVTMDDLFE